tara:strand:- start:325 stop:543 length:219 start_codon:yes stop_codon:yes gene_type:complete
MEIFIFLIVVILLLYFGFFYESNHARHMRRIRECREDWRKKSENLSSTNINKDLPSEENLKLTEEEKENLRT